MIKHLGQGCAAVLVTFLAIVFGAGGGCLIGSVLPTHSRDWMAGLDRAMNDAVIGAGIGFLVGLAAALVIALRKPPEEGQSEATGNGSE
jgi:hypothetical protein